MLGVSDDAIISLWIGGALTVIGTVVGVILTIRWKQKRPRFFTNTNPLVRDLKSEVDKLDVSYAGRPVQSLYRTYVGLWNGGRDVVNWGDLSEQDETFIVVQDGTILDVSVAPHAY